MTVSSYTKMLKQLKAKPAKLKRFMKYNKPKERSFGSLTKKCSRCGSPKAHIGRHGMNLCRKCFREVATKIGFKKFS